MQIATAKLDVGVTKTSSSASINFKTSPPAIKITNKIDNNHNFFN